MSLLIISFIAWPVVVLVLGLVALLRCDRDDVPDTVRAFADWFSRGPRLPGWRRPLSLPNQLEPGAPPHKAVGHKQTGVAHVNHPQQPATTAARGKRRGRGRGARLHP